MRPLICDEQESGPWVLSNTLIPIAVAASLPVVKYVVVVRRLPDYNWRLLPLLVPIRAERAYRFVSGTSGLVGPLCCWHLLFSLVGFRWACFYSAFVSFRPRSAFLRSCITSGCLCRHGGGRTKRTTCARTTHCGMVSSVLPPFTCGRRFPNAT